MSKPSTQRRGLEKFPTKLTAGFAALFSAFEYAEDVDADRWDFAVSIRLLRELDCTDTDLRWLVRKNFVEHAREVTLIGDNGRQFQPTGDLTFCKRTCFILTDLGASVARSVVDERRLDAASAPNNLAAELGSTPNHRPDWDPNSRTLYVEGKIVKRFKWRAANQEAVLCAFQEEGWPRRIDDPLSPHPEQDSKRRLSDTIKCLNNKQAHRLIRFHGDGTGEGVVWEFGNCAEESA